MRRDSFILTYHLFFLFTSLIYLSVGLLLNRFRLMTDDTPNVIDRPMSANYQFTDPGLVLSIFYPSFSKASRVIASTASDFMDALVLKIPDAHKCTMHENDDGKKIDLCLMKWAPLSLYSAVVIQDNKQSLLLIFTDDQSFPRVALSPSTPMVPLHILDTQMNGFELCHLYTIRLKTMVKSTHMVVSNSRQRQRALEREKEMKHGAMEPSPDACFPHIGSFHPWDILKFAYASNPGGLAIIDVRAQLNLARFNEWLKQPQVPHNNGSRTKQTARRFTMLHTLQELKAHGIMFTEVHITAPTPKSRADLLTSMLTDGLYYILTGSRDLCVDVTPTGYHYIETLEIDNEDYHWKEFSTSIFHDIYPRNGVWRVFKVSLQSDEDVLEPMRKKQKVE